METLLQDVRFALRMLVRTPGATLVSALTVALGVGATTVIFSLVNAVLLRPLPVAEPAELVTLSESWSGNSHEMMGQSAVTAERYLAYREGSGSVLEGIAAHRYGEFALRAPDGAEMLTGVVASDNYFQVLGVRPALGRFFSPAEDAGGAAPVAVLGHDLWRREFGGDPSVLGRTVSLDSRVFTVIGVAPPEFAGTVVGMVPEVWVPYVAYDRTVPQGTPGSGASRLLMFGRLRPGVEREQAHAALEVVAQRTPVESEAEFVGFRLDPLTGVPAGLRAPAMGFLGMLLATAGLVLLIACTNVAGMLMARAAARRRETAIRLAIGAGRGRLVRQLLTETVVLFLLGGGAGVLVAVLLTRALAAFQPPFPVRVALDLGVDGRVLAFALLVTLATGVVFGLAPALQASRPELLPALRGGEGSQRAGRSRLRSVLVVAQIAMTLLLLVTAGLFVRTLQSALGADTGFDPERVVVAQVSLAPHGYDVERARDFYRRLEERLTAAPEVASVALARYAPMSGNVLSTSVDVLDAASQTERESGFVNYGVVDPGYFATLRIPILAGRGFTDADREGAAPVLVVNQTLAAALWPGESPLGQRIRMDGEVREVVGVARDGKYEGFREEKVRYAYLPFAQAGGTEMTVHVRARGEPGPALAALRREVQALDPNVALGLASHLPGLIDLTLFPQRMAATLIGIFGLLGLLLASVGLYGILAYHVAQRTREIGVRMALGARAVDVLRMVVSQGLALVVVGVAAGLALAFALTRLLTGFLFGVSAADPATFAVVTILLGSTALLAAYLPARRATQVDPVTALRAD